MSLYTITFKDSAGRQVGRVTFEPRDKPHSQYGEVVLVEGGRKFAADWSAVITGHSDRAISGHSSYVGPVNAADWEHVVAAAAELRRRRLPGRRPEMHVDGPTLEQLGIELAPIPRDATY